MNMERRWDIIRRCQECDGEARKSGWVEDNWSYDTKWELIQAYWNGWICDNCEAKIYGERR